MAKEAVGKTESSEAAAEAAASPLEPVWRLTCVWLPPVDEEVRCKWSEDGVDMLGVLLIVGPKTRSRWVSACPSEPPPKLYTWLDVGESNLQGHPVTVPAPVSWQKFPKHTAVIARDGYPKDEHPKDEHPEATKLPWSDPGEAALPAGLVDPDAAADVAMIELLVEAVQKMLTELVQGLTPRNAARVLGQIKVLAETQARLLVSFDPASGVELHAMPHSMRKRRLAKRQNRETTGVQAVREIAAAWRNQNEMGELAHAIGALKDAKAAGLDEVVVKLQVEVDRRLAALLVEKPDLSAVAGKTWGALADAAETGGVGALAGPFSADSSSMSEDVQMASGLSLADYYADYESI